jgi:mRNA interferase HicA
MKRRDLIAHLLTHGCEILREGGNHTVVIHRRVRKATTVPRHREINDSGQKDLSRRGSARTLRGYVMGEDARPCDHGGHAAGRSVHFMKTL